MSKRLLWYLLSLLVPLLQLLAPFSVPIKLMQNRLPELLRELLYRYFPRAKHQKILKLIERTNKMQPCSRIYYSNVS